MTNECAIGCLKDIKSEQDYWVFRDALSLAISALERDRWISVNDKLPEPKTDVLAAWDDGAVWSIWQNWANDNDKDKFLYYVDMGASVHEVTHWMPLPEPPKEDE